MAFVELWARSHFSFLKAAAAPEDIVLRAHELAQRTVGLCDINGLYGIGRAYQESQRIHQPFLVGCELEIVECPPIAVMPLTKAGYGRLCRLITLGKMNAPKGENRLVLTDLLTHNEGLLCFVGMPALENPAFDFESVLKGLYDTFGRRLYLALHRHQDGLSERQALEGLHWSKKLNIPAFASNRPVMDVPQRKPLLDIVTCIRLGTTLSEAGRRLSLNGEAYMKSEAEMLEIWEDAPAAVHLTEQVADQVSFCLSELRYQYPREAIPEGFTSQGFLKHLVDEGLIQRYPHGIPENVSAQIQKELALIFELRFEDYFITIWDIVSFARKQNILCQGRGSAVNSAVCYALGITPIDPVYRDLLFERFISRERREPPDIDVDFEHERREEVIQYIYSKYSYQRAAMVCEVVSYRTRMAVREVAKVFGVPLPIINKLIKWMGHDGFSRFQSPEGLALIQSWGLSIDVFSQIFEQAQALYGSPRHLGIHTGGFVISHDPLIETVPVEKASMEGRYVIQWNKDDVEALGLMKIDVLGLGMLTCIRKAFDLLEKHRGLKFNLANVPLEEPDVFEMVQKADTVGVFQIESRAQMSMLPRVKPRSFYDLIVEVAIVRPGPLQGGMVHPYIRRRQNLEPVEYGHPELEPILKRTLGVPIFQEQVMRIAVVMAGFTPGESDELRRVMSSAWRKGERMIALKQRITQGMQQKGLSQEFAERVYRTIEGFGSYGFPESHAAAFALLTAISCFLKCRYPDVFTCALLNSQPMGFYPPRTLLADAQRHQVLVLPLDIQLSQWDYTLTVQKNELRLGFRSLWGLAQKEIQALVASREQRPFTSLEDVARRGVISRASFLKLVAADSFACFQPERRQALWRALRCEAHWFSQAPSPEDDEAGRQTIPSSSSWDHLTTDYKYMGFSADYHPIGIMRPLWIKRRVCQSSQDLSKKNDGDSCRVLGLIGVRQRPPTAKGTVFLTLEDEFGMMNVIVHSAVYERFRLVLLTESLVEIEGRMQKKDGVIQIIARHVRGLGTSQEMNELFDEARNFS